MTDEQFFSLPYFAIGNINRDDTTTALAQLWSNTTDTPPNENVIAFITSIVDIIERQNKLASVDTGDVVSSIITMYEGITNTTLFPGDPVRLFLSTLAAIISMQNAVSEFTQKQNFLRYASGAHLEHLAAFLNVYRLPAQRAKTVLRYTLSAPRAVPTVIPQGTRATADGKIFFATDKLLIIPVGVMSADVLATCLSSGNDGNNLLPAQINKMVDVIPFVKSVENITETAGGSNIEDDESLRTRARLSVGQFSTAGARMTYLYHALSAHNSIADVSIVGPEDRDGERMGEVDIYVMLKGGTIPEEGGAELQAIENALNKDNVRPLTDKVNVYPVNAHNIHYTVKWFITTEQTVNIQAITDAVWDAVEKYQAWQIERVGRDINPDKLVELCRAAGAKRIEFEGLEFTNIDNTTVARFTACEIIFGGVENE